MIFIDKLKVIDFLDNNTLFLITTPTAIIVDKSKDSNSGIVIFDLSLLKKDEIFFSKDDLDIYSFFKKFSYDELLFYYPENRGLIHVNLQSKLSSFIPLKPSFDSIVLAPLYLWENDILIISDYKGNFYKILLEDRNIIYEKNLKL